MLRRLGCFLVYLARHKWYVLLAGLRLRVPLWRLLIHDWTKLLPGEAIPYVRHFYGGPPNGAALDRSVALHKRRNAHHWEYWDGRAMPAVLVREMVADWLGAARSKGGDAAAWYAANRDVVRLHPDARALVEQLLVDHRSASSASASIARN